MKFKEYLNESHPVTFKSPEGFFDDESMFDDLEDELSAVGVTNGDYSVSDDQITFKSAVNGEVKDILKSLRFKQI